MTGAGSLRCQKVIHCSSSVKFDDAVYGGICEAEKLNLHSVTFPALGTGK